MGLAFQIDQDLKKGCRGGESHEPSSTLWIETVFVHAANLDAAVDFHFIPLSFPVSIDLLGAMPTFGGSTVLLRVESDREA